eukprot:3449333-Rhodomonas_salina.3
MLLRRPCLESPFVLCTHYAVPGADIPISLCTRYNPPGTDCAYGGSREEPHSYEVGFLPAYAYLAKAMPVLSPGLLLTRVYQYWDRGMDLYQDWCSAFGVRN